MVKEKGETQ